APAATAHRAIDAGAEDVRVDERQVEVYSAFTDLDKVRRALMEAGLTVESAELSKLPKTTVALDEKSAVQVLRLLDAIEDLEDVQKVYSNAEFPDAVLLEYADKA
ncbi:MAG: YebC/PmpR family DNA-binding transcriptional regulator, partial [Dehalococcoidia bacterium]